MKKIVAVMLCLVLSFIVSGCSSSSSPDAGGKSVAEIGSSSIVVFPAIYDGKVMIGGSELATKDILICLYYQGSVRGSLRADFSSKMTFEGTPATESGGRIACNAGPIDGWKQYSFLPEEMELVGGRWEGGKIRY